MDLSHELKMNNTPTLIPMKGISRRCLEKNRFTGISREVWIKDLFGG